MQSSAKRETVVNNAQGEVERIADTVDYHSSAGQGLEQKPTQIIHQMQAPAGATESNTSGGVLANAAASIASTLESAKEALSRK